MNEFKLPMCKDYFKKKADFYEKQYRLLYQAIEDIAFIPVVKGQLEKLEEREEAKAFQESEKIKKLDELLTEGDGRIQASPYVPKTTEPLEELLQDEKT